MERMGRSWSTPSRVQSAVSVAIAAALAVIAIFSASDHRTAVVWLSATSMVLLIAASAAASAAAVCLAIGTLATAGIVASAPASPIFAVGLFVAAEAALGSSDDRHRMREDRGLRRDRFRLVGAAVASSIVAGSVIQLAARSDGRESDVYTAIAGVCVVALAGLVLVGARGRSHRVDQPPTT